MSDRFTDLLASRLGITEDQARQMLAVFNGFLFEELERSGSAVIPDVGSFSRDESGTAFEADGALAALIDSRNAGLVDLPASRRPTSHDQQPQEEGPERANSSEGTATDAATDESEARDTFSVDPGETETTGDIGFRLIGIHGERQDSEEIEEGEVYPSLAGDDATEERPVHGSGQDEPATELPSDDFAESVYVAPDDLSPQERADEDFTAEEVQDVEASQDEELEVEAVDHDSEDVAAVVAATHALDEPTHIDAEHASSLEPTGTHDHNPPEDSTMTPPPPDRSTAEHRSGVPWLMIGVIVILVGIVGLAALFVTGDRDEPRRSPITEAYPPAVGETTDEETHEDFNGQDALEAVEPDVTETEPAPPPEAAQPTDPLFGESIDRSQSRYTLVIASLPSQGAAETVMNSWRNRGFRAAVFSETIDGVTRYRVGVGQFDTIAGADAARSEGNVAADLPEGTWVYRYPASTSN